MTRILALIMAILAAPAVAQSVGDGFVCAGPDGDVYVTVGRVDLLSEITGRAQMPDPTILHVYMETDEDFAEHTAFEAQALAGCVPDANTPFDDVAFDGALDAYREAARAGMPTIYAQSPGEAFAAAVAQGG